MVRVEMIVLRKNFVVTYMYTHIAGQQGLGIVRRTALNNLQDKIYDWVKNYKNCNFSTQMFAISGTYLCTHVIKRK